MTKNLTFNSQLVTGLVDANWKEAQWVKIGVNFFLSYLLKILTFRYRTCSLLILRLNHCLLQIIFSCYDKDVRDSDGFPLFITGPRNQLKKNIQNGTRRPTTVLPPLEWFPDEHGLVFQTFERWKIIHWCHPSLWWTDLQSSQNGPVGLLSLFQGRIVF